MIKFNVEWRETGIYIRAKVENKWQSVDIGDPRLPDKEVSDWLRKGGPEMCLRTVMILLGRNREG